MTLSDFLLARISEDEAVARAILEASDADYAATWALPASATVDVGDDSFYAGDQRLARHIARWDPARVLAECEAKRRIVESYLDERTRRDIYWQADEGDLNDEDRKRRQSTTARTRGLEMAVEALALPYADHDDYRDEWKL